METVVVGHGRQEEHSDDAPKRAEEDGQGDKGPVPDMVVVDGGRSHEDKDDGLRADRQHLHGVLERYLRGGGDIPPHVVLHDDAAERDGEDARELEHLRVEIRHVGHAEDDQRFEDAGVVRKSCHEAGGEAPNDTNQSSTQCYDEKGYEAFDDVHGGDVIGSDVDVGFEHVVEDDGDGIVEQGLAKDDNVEDLVYVDLLEYGQHSDGVHGHDE